MSTFSKLMVLHQAESEGYVKPEWAKSKPSMTITPKQILWPLYGAAAISGTAGATALGTVVGAGAANKGQRLRGAVKGAAIGGGLAGGGFALAGLMQYLMLRRLDQGATA